MGPDLDLQTARLRLRRFTPGDLDELAALHGDPAVLRYIDGSTVPREVVAEQTLPSILRAYAELPPELGYRVVEERADGRFAGWVNLAAPASFGLEDEEGLELGYRLRREVWGRGYAAEAARLVVDRAFAGLGAERIVATTMAVNAGSRRVLDKLGFRHARTFFAEWPEYLEGAEHGDVVYELTRPRWLSAGGRAVPG